MMMVKGGGIGLMTGGRGGGSKVKNVLGTKCQQPYCSACVGVVYIALMVTNNNNINIKNENETYNNSYPKLRKKKTSLSIYIIP